MRDSDPILDWFVNENYPEAYRNAFSDPIVGLLTSASPLNAQEQLAGKMLFSPPTEKWELLDTNWLFYPGLPAMEPIAHAFLHGEQIFTYYNNFYCIVQPDGRFTVGRLK